MVEFTNNQKLILEARATAFDAILKLNTQYQQGEKINLSMYNLLYAIKENLDNRLKECF